MFELGSCVVYGIHGVCRVIGKEKQLVDRKRAEYLVLEPIGQNESRFYLPAANPIAMAKLKQVLSKKELENLISSNEVHVDCWIPEENLRKQRYRELISGGDRTALLQMVHTLYQHRQIQLVAGRKVHLCDENFLRDAERLVAGETAMVMSLEPEEAKQYIRAKLKEDALDCSCKNGQ